ncbi:MAG: XdhC family protein [Planctomycetota bacterium]
MRDLLTALTAALDARRPCVFCSLVETRGSTPQKAGAAMLVFADGGQVGTLGGGCVEAEVKRQALATLAGDEAGKPELFTFNLDDNYGWDDGLICGGRMTILADPLGDPLRDPQRTAYFQRFRQIVEQGVGCTEAVPSQASPDTPVGSRFLFDAAGQLAATLGAAAAPAHVVDNLTPLLFRPRPYHKMGVAYLPVLPRITLLIVGGGHVGLATAKLAAEVDFEIWILDDRESYASAERFPMAGRRFIGDIGQTLRTLGPELNPTIYALIVTRGHAHDEEALLHLANTSCGYVGLIGSKRKIKMIYEDLLAKNIPAIALRKVYAPLGFDIGSQTVPEIAVSIVAELIAVRNLGQTIVAARTTIPV